jgi:hypothetical protein
MRKVNLNRGFSIRLIAATAVFLGLLACDFLPGKPKKVEFLDQSFAVLMPSSWAVRNDLNDVADLQMGNPFKEAYTIIISENKMDFEEMTLEDHSDITRSMIRQSLKDYQESEPEELYVGEIRALRYQLTGSIDGLNIVYWHVTFETDEYYHQMLLWSLKSKFPKNQADFDSVINSFEVIYG